MVLPFQPSLSPGCGSSWQSPLGLPRPEQSVSGTAGINPGSARRRARPRVSLHQRAWAQVAVPRIRFPTPFHSHSGHKSGHKEGATHAMLWVITVALVQHLQGMFRRPGEVGFGPLCRRPPFLLLAGTSAVSERVGKFCSSPPSGKAPLESWKQYSL